MKALIIYKSDVFLKGLSTFNQGSVSLNGHDIKYALVELNMPFFNLDANPNSVLVKKVAFSCNYRDIGIILQSHSRLTSHNPFAAIGSEFSGVVVDKGRNVKEFQIGDRVIPNAEYPSHTGNFRLNGLPTNQSSLEYEMFHRQKLIKIPESLSFEEGAGFTIGTQTVYSMINKLKIRNRQKGLLLGMPSNTSLFALNALKKFDVDLYIGMRSIKKTYKFGFDNNKVFVIPDAVKNFLEIDHIFEDVSIYGKFDFIIDPFSDSNLFRLLDIIAINGRYITCGISNQTTFQNSVVQNPSFFGNLIMNNITIIGNCLGNKNCIVKAIDDFKNGLFTVPLGKVVSDDINKFMELTFINKSALGKIVFKY